jgi:acyl-CoA thioesterase FadM
MKKSSKPAILIVLILLMVVTGFALVGVGIKLKYEQSLLLRDDLEKKVKTEGQRKIKLTAEYQTVTAEDRIISIAANELGLIRNMQPSVIIKFNKEKLVKVTEELSEKYE